MWHAVCGYYEAVQKEVKAAVWLMNKSNLDLAGEVGAKATPHKNLWQR